MKFLRKFRGQKRGIKECVVLTHEELAVDVLVTPITMTRRRCRSSDGEAWAWAVWAIWMDESEASECHFSLDLCFSLSRAWETLENKRAAQ